MAKTNVSQNTTPSLPTIIGPNVSDDVSAISTANQSAMVFLLAPPNSTCTSDVWNFFHVIKGVKEGVDESMIPDQWSDDPTPGRHACCNLCGKMVRLGSLRANGSFRKSNSGMRTHLESAAHQQKGVKILLEELRSVTSLLSCSQPERQKHKKSMIPKNKIVISYCYFLKNELTPSPLLEMKMGI